MAMTKNTKIIIGVVSGLVLIGGFVVVVAAAIGISYLAAQQPDAKPTINKRTDKPLTAEKKLYRQADVDGLLKFHEWASDTKFSADRRKKFESFLDRDFRKDAAKARKDTDDIIETHNKIRAAEKKRAGIYKGGSRRGVYRGFSQKAGRRLCAVYASGLREKR